MYKHNESLITMFGCGGKSSPISESVVEIRLNIHLTKKKPDNITCYELHFTTKPKASSLFSVGVWAAIQEDNFTLGSALALQMFDALNGGQHAMNCTLYAKLVLLLYPPLLCTSRLLCLLSFSLSP
jgi:hypothetical protein